MRISVPTSLALLLCILSNATAADNSDIRAAMALELEQVAHTGELSNGVDIAARDLLVDVYASNDYALNWTEARKTGELLDAIKAAEADGLDPSDYHIQRVVEFDSLLRSGGVATPQQRVVADLTLTDALARLGYHQRFGKVNPYGLDPFWNFDRTLGDLNPREAIQSVIDAESLVDRLYSYFPRGWYYRQLQGALARYRGLAKSGGWPQLADGPTLRPGDQDERLSRLAQRLGVTGDLSPDAASANHTFYGAELETGVRRFQARHGLDTDGVIGPATLNALNVTAEARVRQIEVNLERARWVMHNLADNFVLVNIAGFRAYVWKNHEIVWQTKVQVGRTYHQSPVFKDVIKYLDFNPTWTVPWSIATKEMLPQIKADPDYFNKRDFDVKDRNGQVIDPNTVDWSKLSRGNFPYTLVQRPGPGNALGRVKFMFPNKHSVYLHDTPSKYLFGRAGRAFSHGCIRVENPFDLAEVLLGDDGWTQEKFQEVLDSQKTTTVFLAEPIPVLLLYWTAEVDNDGVVYFYNDVYERDQRILDMLDQPFKLDVPQN